MILTQKPRAMPTIEKVFTLEISPERFVNACSVNELQELIILLSSTRIQAKINQGRSCRECGCTNMDCRVCIERTGKACHWVEDDLCSACVDATKFITNE